MRRISSRQNALVAAFRAAAAGDRDGPMLLDGPHLVAEALTAGISIRHAIVAADAPQSPELASLVERLAAARIDIVEGASAVMSAVSPVRSPSRIVAIADRPHATARPGGRRHPNATTATPLVVIACDVQDPGNLGAIVRVAEAAGATAVIAAGASADPYSWKTLRGSMGSVLRLAISSERNLTAAVDRVRVEGLRVCATVPRGGRGLYDTPLTGPIAVLIGGEGGGLPSAVVDAADERVTIPMAAPVESLNAAVTAAVVLYEASRQRAHHGSAVS